MECDNLADESRKAEIEHTKQEQLREQKEGKGEWKQGLASESESVVCFSPPNQPNIVCKMQLAGRWCEIMANVRL